MRPGNSLRTQTVPEKFWPPSLGQCVTKNQKIYISPPFLHSDWQNFVGYHGFISSHKEKKFRPRRVQTKKLLTTQKTFVMCGFFVTCLFTCVDI